MTCVKKLAKKFLNHPKKGRYNACKNCNKCDFQIDTLLENIFNKTPDIITFMDTKFRYAMCSKEFLNLFGFETDNEIIGKTPFELLHYDQYKTIKTYLNLVIAERSPKTYIQKFYNPEGIEQIYESVSSPIINNNNVVGILTLSRNITETIYLRKSLEVSNAKLYALINNSPMLAYVIDKNGKFILGNARAKKLFEKGIDVTSTGEQIKFDIDSMLENILNENSEILKSGKDFNTERQVQARNGEKYWYAINKSPLMNREGEYYAVTTFARDIDAEKRIQEQRETYIATLSHDLKTPAIAQVRALELLLSGELGEFNKDQKEMLKLTLDSCNYMYDMVYTLLSTCKFESGEVTLNYSQFDITKLVLESIHEISKLAQDNLTLIEFEPNMKSCIINADRIEIKRVVINFLSNAINYAFPSTNINVSLATNDNNIILKVKNRSHYIEPEAMDRIFRKYVTHSEKFNKVGIGLGLYLSKQIIEAHNGTVIAESSKDETNIFGFKIPIEPATDITRNKTNKEHFL
ncbi:MAG: PAS domain S-box protein [Candidatus Gastranaerophilales bacterium]|nr:PAS domain S-box protein [Candidatus Gastranaerophilales bacterium]